jgi:hypothetical protein
MKQEVQDIAVEAAKAAPGLLASSFTLNTAVALATLCFIILQIVYLIRKWVREETEWGRKLKRWATKKPHDDKDTDLGTLE